MKGLLITLGVFIILGIVIAIWAISVSNNEKMLRNKIEAQQEVTEAFYTKLWEIIKTKANVADEYAEKFKEIQIEIMEGRYSTGGNMMKWIQEANPDFNEALYQDLMNSIEGERNGFFIEQKKLRDMQKLHEDMLVVFPKNIVLRNREAIDVIILKNVATQNAYETEIDSSPELF